MDPLDLLKGESDYLKCMLEQAEHDPGSVDWRSVYEMMDEIHAEQDYLDDLQEEACYVDECQSEQSDWRWA